MHYVGAMIRKMGRGHRDFQRKKRPVISRCGKEARGLAFQNHSWLEKLGY
jgi:hypothetical protein